MRFGGPQPTCHHRPGHRRAGVLRPHLRPRLDHVAPAGGPSYWPAADRAIVHVGRLHHGRPLAGLSGPSSTTGSSTARKRTRSAPDALPALTRTAWRSAGACHPPRRRQRHRGPRVQRLAPRSTDWCGRRPEPTISVPAVVAGGARDRQERLRHSRGRLVQRSEVCLSRVRTTRSWPRTPASAVGCPVGEGICDIFETGKTWPALEDLIVRLPRQARAPPGRSPETLLRFGSSVLTASSTARRRLRALPCRRRAGGRALPRP